MSTVFASKTSPETVLADYGRLLHWATYLKTFDRSQPIILKLNLSWTRFYPACSTWPWQLEGVLETLIEDGIKPKDIIPVENRTVVTDVIKGSINNKWLDILKRYGVKMHYLTEEPYVEYKPKTPLLVMGKVFHKITLPKIIIGKNIIHLPTMKCVHPQTKLFLKNGELVGIGKLINGQLGNKNNVISDYEGDIQIQSIVELPTLTNNGSLSFHPALALWKTPLKNRPVYCIKTRTGREIMTSEAHPFLTPLGWKEGQLLKPGDRIAITRKISIEGQPQSLPEMHLDPPDLNIIGFRPGKKYSIILQRSMLQDYLYNYLTMEEIGKKYHAPYQIVQSLVKRYCISKKGRNFLAKTPKITSPAFWRWLGYIFAEGWFEQTKTSFRIWWANSTPNIQQDFIQKTQELFGITPKKRYDDNCYYFDNLSLKEFFGKLALPPNLKAANKRVPPLLYCCPDEEIAAFLGGYLDGDGGIGKDGLHVTTKSKNLAQDIQFLCQRLGVITFLKSYYRYLPPKKKVKRKYYDISIYGYDLVSLGSLMRLLHQDKQKKLELLIARHHSGKKPSNWDTIPLDKEVFKRVRIGLKLTQESTKKPASVNGIENGYQLPTREIIQYFIRLFKQRDAEKQFQQEIDYLAFLANPEIAWDKVVSVKKISTSIPYLYDITMDPTENFIGNGFVLHNTHVFTTTTGAIKNYFGMLRTTRHYAHRHIHETLVDLLSLQKEIHPGIFGVMDGTVVGRGSGPRAMEWKIKNYLLASYDLVALDATAAKMMGFGPLGIDYLSLSQRQKLGVASPSKIKIVGENIGNVNWHYKKKDTFASWGQKLIYQHSPLWLEKLLLQSPLVPWSYLASNFYHDLYWWNLFGRKRVNKFLKTGWGRLFTQYPQK